MTMPARPPKKEKHNPKVPEFCRGVVLSKVAVELNYDLRDVEAWVRRSPEQRRKGKKNLTGGRPSNGFMLYRSIYNALIAVKYGELKQDTVSQVIGHSWSNETTDFKDSYRAYAEIEKQNHILTFGARKYEPKRKPGAGGAKTAAGRKVATKASKLAERYQHIQAPTRSPEPIYYPVDGTPSAEVPSLNSYQGTPLTSSVTTPQPQHAYMVPYTEALGAPYGPAFCGDQVPYGSLQAGNYLSYGWSSQQFPQQERLSGQPTGLKASEYPDPTVMNMSPYTADHGQQNIMPIQGPMDFSSMPMVAAMGGPGLPVLREQVGSGGSMNPRDMSLENEPQLYDNYEPRGYEDDSFSLVQEGDRQGTDSFFDMTPYLEGGDWVAEKE